MLVDLVEYTLSNSGDALLSDLWREKLIKKKYMREKKIKHVGKIVNA